MAAGHALTDADRQGWLQAIECSIAESPADIVAKILPQLA